MIQFKGQLASRYNSKSKTFWRTNQNIQAANLRVIGSDGKQVGVLSRDEALQKAKEAELDLVEIAASANPPVAKIIDFVKFKYQQDKKEREAKFAERKGSEVKEVWLSPFMADNDYKVRLDKIKEFLTDGNKVRIAVKFTGRQLAHREFGYQLTKRVSDDAKEISKVDGEPKFLGRQLLMTLTPVKKRVQGEERSVESANIVN